MLHLTRHRSDQAQPIDTPTAVPTSDDPRQSANRGRLVARPRVLTGGAVTSLAFFALTSPKSVPSVLLIAGFVVLGMLLYCVLRLLLLITGLYEKLSPTHAHGLLITGTILPVLLLMMQSIGQLTVRDVLTLGGLFCIGIFYSSRVRKRL